MSNGTYIFNKCCITNYQLNNQLKNRYVDITIV